MTPDRRSELLALTPIGRDALAAGQAAFAAGPAGEKGDLDPAGRWVTVGGQRIHITSRDTVDAGGHPALREALAEKAGLATEPPPVTPHEVKDFYGEPHAVTSWPADWGLGPGTYRVWRAGSTDTARGSVFTSPDRASAEVYSHDGKRPVAAYDATVKNPVVAENQYDLLARLTGKTRQDVYRQRDRAKSVLLWLRKVDKQIATLAAAAGHDAVVYTRPMPPALRELAVLPGATIRPAAA